MRLIIAGKGCMHSSTRALVVLDRCCHLAGWNAEISININEVSMIGPAA